MEPEVVSPSKKISDVIRILVTSAEELSSSVRNENLRPVAFQEVFRVLANSELNLRKLTSIVDRTETDKPVDLTQNIKKLTLPEFMRRCPVSKDTERFAAILYYLEKHAGKPFASIQEIAKAWSDGKLSKKPRNPADVKARAIKKGFITESSEPGMVHVTIDGESFIESKLNAPAE